jgi:hypothetical protein
MLADIMPRRPHCAPPLPFPPPVGLDELAQQLRAVSVPHLVAIADRLLTHLAIAKLVLESRDVAAFDRWWAQIQADGEAALAALDALDDEVPS